MDELSGERDSRHRGAVLPVSTEILADLLGIPPGLCIVGVRPPEDSLGVQFPDNLTLVLAEDPEVCGSRHILPRMGMNPAEVRLEHGTDEGGRFIATLEIDA